MDDKYEEELIETLEDAYEHCEYTSDMYTLDYCIKMVECVADRHDRDIDAYEYVKGWLESNK